MTREEFLKKAMDYDATEMKALMEKLLGEFKAGLMEEFKKKHESGKEIAIYEYAKDISVIVGSMANFTAAVAVSLAIAGDPRNPKRGVEMAAAMLQTSLNSALIRLHANCEKEVSDTIEEMRKAGLM